MNQDTRPYFFNESNNESNVSQAIDGYLSVSNNNLARIAAKHYKVVMRSDYENHQDKVAVISGGGAGHEPLHSEFVGRGMLTAAVCGEKFASPSVNAILSAVLLATGDKGCLLIVKNYTGDRLNFAIAAERARIMGKKVEILMVADDIAIPHPQKRRGIAGTVLIHKIAGYLSERGLSLSEIKSRCESAAKGLFSLGLTILTNSSDSEVKVEKGAGIHGEPGTLLSLTTQDIAKEAVEIVLHDIIAQTDESSLYAVLVNNLGGCTPLEMSIITSEVLNSSFKNRIKYAIGSASFCTSLDMPGFSLSLLALTNEIEEALLSEVEPLAWVKPVIPVQPEQIDIAHLKLYHKYIPSQNQKNREVVEKICNVAIASKERLNALDKGDGDSGDTLSTIATYIKAELDNLPLDNPAHLLLAIGQLIESVGVGTSGVLLSLIFTHGGNALEETSSSLATALKKGVEAMMRYAGSKVGDRSMLDALVPAIEGLEKKESLQAVAEASRKGANFTSSMTAKVGRLVNVDPKEYLGFNDSGAEAVALIFERLAEEK